MCQSSVRGVRFEISGLGFLGFRDVEVELVVSAMYVIAYDSVAWPYFGVCTCNSPAHHVPGRSRWEQLGVCSRT